MWTKKQIEQHVRAAKALACIKDEVFSFLKLGVTEYETVEFIRGLYEEHGLWSDHDPICAFGKNTSHVHYFASQYSLSLRKNALILLDLWARVRERGAPFADITWMGFCGLKPSLEAEEVFRAVRGARDASVRFLRRRAKEGSLPLGKGVDAIARDFLAARGHEKEFSHSLGHSLGFRSPHGRGVVLGPRRGGARLEQRVGYTIEPGVYLKNRFGVRSEVDFYIDKDEVVITTPVQRNLYIVR